MDICTIASYVTTAAFSFRVYTLASAATSRKSSVVMFLKKLTSLRFCASVRDFSWPNSRSVKDELAVAGLPGFAVGAEAELTAGLVSSLAARLATARTNRKTQKKGLITATSCQPGAGPAYF